MNCVVLIVFLRGSCSKHLRKGARYIVNFQTMQHRTYSERDLSEFKKVILEKIERTAYDIESLEEQRENVGKRFEHNESYADDSKADQLLLKLSGLLEKRQNYLQQLQAALLRIENKSYGIDSTTGELIDKERLLAEPTATQNI